MWGYRFLWLLLLPFISVMILWRLIKGKEPCLRFGERLGISTFKRPEGDLIWFHCASIGESLSILPLIDTLLKADNKRHILVTTGTVTSAKLMAKKLPKRAYHQFIPLDFYPCVRLFLSRMKPTISIFVESEFWPELMRHAPSLMLINARISDASFATYQKYPAAANTLIHHVQLAAARTSKDADRLAGLGLKNVHMTGDLKLDFSHHTSAIPPAWEAIKKSHKIIVAASTHDPEEKWISEQFSRLQKDIPNSLLIIVPRHPHRGTRLEKNLAAYKPLRRSAGHLYPSKNTSVYIADTIGEMSLWYQLADVVIIGGSFISHGGQNPYEPLCYGTPVLCGPHMFNFHDMMVLFTERGLVKKLANEQKIMPAIKEELENPTPAHSIEKKLRDLGGATTKVADLIHAHLQENV